MERLKWADLGGKLGMVSVSRPFVIIHFFPTEDQSFPLVLVILSQ